MIAEPGARSRAFCMANQSGLAGAYISVSTVSTNFMTEMGLDT